jgi:hypothetical protein
MGGEEFGAGDDTIHVMRKGWWGEGEGGGGGEGGPIYLKILRVGSHHHQSERMY